MAKIGALDKKLFSRARLLPGSIQQASTMQVSLTTPLRSPHSALARSLTAFVAALVLMIQHVRTYSPQFTLTFAPSPLPQTFARALFFVASAVLAGLAVCFPCRFHKPPFVHLLPPFVHASHPHPTNPFPPPRAPLAPPCFVYLRVLRLALCFPTLTLSAHVVLCFLH